MVLQFDDLRSMNKELLELGLEVGSLQKRVYFKDFTVLYLSRMKS